MGRESQTDVGSLRRGRRHRRKVAAVLGGAVAAGLAAALLAGLTGATAAGTCNGFEGRMTLEDPEPGFPSLAVADVPVEATLPGETTPVDSDVTGADGRFCFDVSPGDYEVTIGLDEPEQRFRIVHDATVDPDPPAPRPVFGFFALTAADFGGSSPVPVEFLPSGHVFVRGDRRAVTATPVSGGALVAAMHIYLRSHQFLDWWEDALSATQLSGHKVHIAIASARAASSGAHYASARNAIEISTGDTRYTERRLAPFGASEAPENTEWHELAHYIFDLDGLAAERRATPQGSFRSHGGYSNISTADSLEEGWASFVAGVAGASGEIDGVATDDLYAQFGSMESNWRKPWTRKQEDHAFTGLLWDLFDGTEGGAEGTSNCAFAGCDDEAIDVHVDGIGGDAIVTDRVTLDLETIYDVLSTVPEHGGTADLTIAGFHDNLIASPQIPDSLKVPTIDIGGSNEPDISAIDAVFMMHGFYPCDVDGANPECAYVMGTPVGRTDHVPDGGSGLVARRQIPSEPGAEVQVVNPTSSAATVSFRITEDGRVRTYAVPVAARRTEVIPLDLPPSSSAPLVEEASPPPCSDTAAHDQLIALHISDDRGGVTDRTNCQYNAAVAASAGRPALTHVVGGGGSSHRVAVVPPLATPDPTHVALAGHTFAEVSAALAADTTPTIEMPIPGLAPITDIPASFTADSTNKVVALSTDAPVSVFPAAGASVLAGVPVDVMVLADWASDTDTSPKLALAVRAPDQALADLNPAWRTIAGNASTAGFGFLGLDDAVLAFVPGGSPVSFDPAHLPAAVADFFDVGGPGGAIDLAAVANLRASLDLDSLPILGTAGRMFGLDPAAAVQLAGGLADTAGLLFDREVSVDPAAFRLDAPFMVDSSTFPPWLKRGIAALGLDLPEFRLRIDPSGPTPVPYVDVHDTIDVVTGDVTNRLDYEVRLAEAASQDVRIHAPAFVPPYGLARVATLHDVDLHLVRDAAHGTFRGTFDATVQMGGSSPRVHVAVNDQPSNRRATVSVDGSIGVGDLVSALAGSSAFGAGDFGPIQLGSASLSEIEFTYDSNAATNHDVLGLLARIDGIAAITHDSPTLRTRFLVGVDDTPTANPTLLTALRVDDTDCDGGRCVALHQILPIPSGSLGADLRLPAVNFASVTPNGSAFTTGALGPNARAFLAEVNGSPASDPFTLTGGLNLIADVPIGGLQPILQPLGIHPTSDSVHVVGSAGFSLPQLDDGTSSAVLDTFRVEASLAGVDASPPPGFPAWLHWPSTGQWRLFLAFDEKDPNTDADDTVAVGAAVDGITTDLFATATPTLDLEASFEGTPANNPTDWTVTARARMGTWSHPFGIQFLTVDEATAVLTIAHHAGTTTPSAQLCGDFTIGSERVRVCLDIAGTNPPSATVTLDLLTPVSVQDVVDLTVGGFLGQLGVVADLPPAVGSARFGPGQIVVKVTGDGRFSIDAVAQAGFRPFAHEIAADLLFSAHGFGAGTPQVTLGVRPRPGLMLSHILPASVQIPIDLPLTPGGSDSGFGFVFSSDEIDPGSPEYPAAVHDWFSPLFGGDLSGRTVGRGPGVLGSFDLPAPLDDFLAGIGIVPKVQLSGSIPLPDPAGSVDLGGVAMQMSLRLRNGLLPEFVDGASLDLGGGVHVANGQPSFFVSLSGSLRMRFKQGMDEGLADTLDDIGLHFPVATPVSASTVCPRGGANQLSDAGDASSDRFCYDRLLVTIGGELNVSILPPKVDATVFADLTSLNTPTGTDWGWSPLGVRQIVIRQLTGQATLGFDPSTPPFTVVVKLGLGGNLQLFGKNVSGAIQAGVKIDPIVVPPKPPTFVPLFDGLRISLPDGLFTDDIVNAYNALASGIPGASPLPAAVASAVPNVGVRNLYFSISPVGVQSLCIDQGLFIRGDLYIDPDPASAPMPDGVCNRQTGQMQRDPASSAPPALCTDRKNEGCVAGVHFAFSPAGLIADGSVAAFDLGPQIRFQDLVVSLRLTAAEQRLRLRGGVALGPAGSPYASGQMAFDAQALPPALQFAGQLRIFGFNALVDARFAGGDPFDLLKGRIPNPNLNLHVVLAAPELATGPYGGEPDFATRVAQLTRPLLQQLQDVVRELDDFLDDFTADPLGTLLDLPDRLRAMGVDVPGWISDLAHWVQQFDVVKGDDPTAATLDLVLNGTVFPGVESVYIPAQRTCVGFFTYDPTKPLSATNPSLGEGYVDGDGVCWAFWPGGFPIPHGFFQDPICMGVEARRDPLDPGSPVRCYLPGLAPVAFPGALLQPFGASSVCQLLFPAAAAPSSPGGQRCTTSEVRAVARAVFDDALQQLLGLASGAVGDAADAIRSFVEGTGDLTVFSLRCADLRVAFSALGDRSARAALDATVLGQRLAFALGIDFDDLPGSAAALVSEFFRVLTGGPGDVCSGVDPALFGPGGPGAPPGTDPAGTGASGPPPPPVLSIAASLAVVVENHPTNLTVSFDRTIVASDGARAVTIDWEDDGVVDQTVTIPVGGRTATVAHTYADDDPTGTAFDIYRVRAVDTGPGGGVDTTGITVHNARPAALTATLSAAAIDEDGTLGVTVGWTDAGPLDTHRLRIDWGDGHRETRADVAPGVVLTHRYRDDDPTGTPADEYRIAVTVTDDDTGSATVHRSVTVRNVAPSDIVVAPSTTDEGAPTTYTVRFADPGTLDTHDVDVDFDGDGVFEQHRALPAGVTSAVFVHRYADDDPTATPQDPAPVRVRASDDDTGTTTVNRTLTVRNVAPSVCVVPAPAVPDGTTCGSLQSTTVDENSSVTVAIAWDDPGLPDTHTVRVDWGHASLPATVLHPEPGARTATATRVFGDNGTYTVTVTVTDDDTGAGSATARVVVLNVDPTAAIDESAAVLADGPDEDAVLDEPTFITRAGQNTSFRARATDPGSDDETFRWDWDASDRFDRTATETKYRVNPPANDPLPSPTVQPRDVTDSPAHRWSQPCLYEVGLTVTDDDGGSATERTFVVVTGTDSTVRSPGWWYNQILPGIRNKGDLPDETVQCYLEIAQHMSRVFRTVRNASDFGSAAEVLKTLQSNGDANQLMERQLLTAWLNFANGSIGWNDMVDINRDRKPDRPFSAVVTDAESVRLDPWATRDDLLAQEAILKSVNRDT